MKKNKTIYVCLLSAVILGSVACKKQLDVGNPNSPTLSGNINSEAGLISFAQGGIYINGFVNGDGWLGDSYFSLPYSYIELLGGTIGADLGSNNQVTTVSQPDYVILDDGTTKVENPSPQVSLLRGYNSRAATNAANNVLYYQWLNMYAMNGACNQVLSLVDNIKFSGDAASRTNTIKAWCYWWKGYAYSEIGSLYYSGLINDEFGAANSHYVVKDSILARSDYYFKLAASTLSAVTSVTDFTTVLGKLIPQFCQTGNGQLFTSTDMWVRNINTMLARNILLNKLSPFVKGNPAAAIAKSSTTAMTTADWNQVLAYATTGIKDGDYVFTGRSVTQNYFFSSSAGTTAAMTCGSNKGTTFIITERYIQDFGPGDKRLANNFNTLNTNLTEFFSTRYSLIDGGNGAAGVWSYGSTAVGDYELYIAGSYEENALMLAEANIRLGSTDAGLAFVDAERTYQGAGVAAVSGKGLSLAEALTELTNERKVALLFRGLSFYDSRRWGWTYDISNGGGSYGNVFITSEGKVNTNATINYNFLDYWDVPADETDLNKPDGSSAAVMNPNYN